MIGIFIFGTQVSSGPIEDGQDLAALEIQQIPKKAYGFLPKTSLSNEVV